MAVSPQGIRSDGRSSGKSLVSMSGQVSIGKMPGYRFFLYRSVVFCKFSLLHEVLYQVAL